MKKQQVKNLLNLLLVLIVSMSSPSTSYCDEESIGSIELRAGNALLATQHEDGSWLAESHVKFKAQTYFENGDPHGEHQFLSTAATAWATAGLAQLLPAKADSTTTAEP